MTLMLYLLLWYLHCSHFEVIDCNDNCQKHKSLNGIPSLSPKFQFTKLDFISSFISNFLCCIVKVSFTLYY